MNPWELRPVALKFQMSDRTLLSVSLPLQVRAVGLVDQTPVHDSVPQPDDTPHPDSQGFLIRGLPLSGPQPTLQRVGDYLCYIPAQYQHCYIDFDMSFADYQKKFSSKTRSTINRKIRKFREHCGGELEWKVYTAPGEMREFFAHARAISVLTYQERLLDAGIPGDEAFIAHAESLAAQNQVRAYILFDNDRPVSYLYCPIRDGVLIYAYLGYDPEYMHLSVGTVLQWLAVEHMFNEGGYRYFDFTEGQADHKRLFATHQRQCANVFLLRDTLRNRLLVRAHMLANGASERIGKCLDELGLKARLKRILRASGA